MTIGEALTKAEEILGSLPVSGRENVRKVNAIFELLDATMAAMTQSQEHDKGENDGTV
jgi:hypothetical protein